MELKADIIPNEQFAWLKSNNGQAQEQPNTIGPFRVWIVRGLAHTLNEYFVS